MTCLRIVVDPVTGQRHTQYGYLEGAEFVEGKPPEPAPPAPAVQIPVSTAADAKAIELPVSEDIRKMSHAQVHVEIAALTKVVAQDRREEIIAAANKSLKSWVRSTSARTDPMFIYKWSESLDRVLLHELRKVAVEPTAAPPAAPPAPVVPVLRAVALEPEQEEFNPALADACLFADWEMTDAKELLKKNARRYGKTAERKEAWLDNFRAKVADIPGIEPYLQIPKESNAPPAPAVLIKDWLEAPKQVSDASDPEPCARAAADLPAPGQSTASEFIVDSVTGEATPAQSNQQSELFFDSHSGQWLPKKDFRWNAETKEWTGYDSRTGTWLPLSRDPILILVTNPVTGEKTEYNQHMQQLTEARKQRNAVIDLLLSNPLQSFARENDGIVLPTPASVLGVVESPCSHSPNAAAIDTISNSDGSCSLLGHDTQRKDEQLERMAKALQAAKEERDKRLAAEVAATNGKSVHQNELSEVALAVLPIPGTSSALLEVVCGDCTMEFEVTDEQVSRKALLTAREERDKRLAAEAAAKAKDLIDEMD